MKYIITKFFEKQFRKISTNGDIELLINKINLRSKSFIGLAYPFFKLKINTKNKSYRIIITYEKSIATMLFINAFDKKDKNIGENINWKLHEKLILYWTDKNMECISKKQYYNIFK